MGELSASVAHQQAAADAGAPLGVCARGQVVAVLTAAEEFDYHRHGLAGEVVSRLIRACARANRLQPEDFEILLVCHIHSRSSAVDCLDCVPADDDGS